MAIQNTSSQNDIIKFFRRVSLFGLPLMLLLSFPAYVFVRSGEGMSTGAVIDAQISGTSPVLFGAAYGNSTAHYKLRYLYDFKPTIIVLGTSRVTQFRSGFFTAGTRFLNAGGSISRIEQFREFLDKIPQSEQPDTILIGLDQNLFDPSWRGRTPIGIDELSVADSPVSIFLNSWTKIYRDYYRGKFTTIDLTGRSKEWHTIGLNARRNGNGFRNDGSYRYGYFLEHPDAREAVLAEIHDFNNLSTTDSHLQKAQGSLDEASVQELESFLKLAAERNIRVIGFLPPYPPSVYATLFEDATNYPYIFSLHARLRPLFTTRGFSFYDFSDSAAFGSSDEEMIDLIHGSEKTYARLFLKMAEKDSILAPYAAMADIEKRLKTATSSFAIFPD